MEAVRDLRWGSGFVENAVKAHTGFEPVSGESEVPEPLRRKLDELRAQSRDNARHSETVEVQREGKSGETGSGQKDEPEIWPRAAEPAQRGLRKEVRDGKSHERHEREQKRDGAGHDRDGNR